MKFFAVFAAILAVACGYQATWTLNSLSDALQNPTTDPAVIPYLENALNEMMQEMFAGQHASPVAVSIPAIDFSTWTLHELSEAIQNPATDPAILPYLEDALNQMMLAIHQGTVMPVVSVVAPAMDVTYWSIQELSHALSNPHTNPELIPYLEHAVDNIMNALISGIQVEAIVVVTPAGLVSAAPETLPIVPAPSPAEEVVVPTPAEEATVPAPASPLVQIIINVNAQAAGAAPSPAVTPEAVADKPEPIIVVDQPEPIKPEPVIVVDPIVPEPVIVVDPIVSEPVIVDDSIVIPTPVIVNPGLNPVDVLHPVPVVTPINVA